jgi:hypothetical protein
LEKKDIEKIAKYIGITKAELVKLIDKKKMDELFLKELKTITTIEGCLELYLMTPLTPLVSESDIATLTKLHELLSEKLKTVTTVDQVKNLYKEAKTDVEQEVYIWEIYKRF